MSTRKALTAAETEFLDNLRATLLAAPRSALTPDLAAELNNIARLLLDQPSSLTAAVGPVCNTGQAAAWLGVSRQGLHKAINENRILAFQSADGKWLYPTWQFTRAGMLTNALQQTLGRLEKWDRFSRAEWLYAENPELDGLSPAQWIEDSRDTPTLLAAAKKAGARARKAKPVPHSAKIALTPMQRDFYDAF